MCCLVAAPVVEPCCFGGSGAGEGTVGVLYMLHHEKCFAALCGGNRLAGGGGVKSLVVEGEEVVVAATS